MGATKSQPLWVDKPTAMTNDVEIKVADKTSPLLNNPKKTAPLSRFHGMFRFR